MNLLTEYITLKQKEKELGFSLPQPTYLFIEHYGRSLEEDLPQLADAFEAADYFCFSSDELTTDSKPYMSFFSTLQKHAPTGQTFQGCILISLSERMQAEGSYHFIASLFISQIYEVLIQAAQKSETKTLNIRMNFVIDEFANLPKLTNIDSMITASRSRNIRFSLIVQGLTQLKNKYDDAALTLCGNCNNWIYLYSKDYELLHTLSQLCGEVVYDDHTRLPLLSEFDLQHLSKEKGEVLILSDRKYPFLSHLTDIDDYTFFREFPENPEPAEQAVEDTKEVPSDDYRPLSGPFHELEFPTTCFAPKYQKPVPMPKTLFNSLAGENAITSDWSYCRGPKRWLVATLDNIIIAEKTLPEDEFDSPDILENLIKYFGKRDVIGDYMLRSYITFYHADLRNKKDYESYLSKHPEVLYLRIDEMEHPEDFIPISSSTDTHNNDDQKTEDSNED